MTRPEHELKLAAAAREISWQSLNEVDRSQSQFPPHLGGDETLSRPPLLLRETEPPPVIRKEPARDWEFGLITGHRLRVVFYLCTTIFALNLLQNLIGLRSQKPVELFDHIWSWGTLLWLGAVFPVTFSLLGMLSFRFPNNLDDVEPIGNTICWRIVSSGKNLGVLRDTISRCKEEMARVPLFPYIIEIVVDFNETAHLLASGDPRIRVIIVPSGFITPNRTRFKARALHYALLNSPLPDDAWIVHLDEETRPTSSGIKGICRMVREEEQTKRPRIGQGGILYHRQWERFPFLTLADNVRTGDDFSRFYFQHRIGMTIFGIHGSFVVVRNDVEKLTGGFDFGPQGDVTEDAFWAVVAMERGLRCRWVDGYLEEQSTHSLIDFLKQRARWFQGLTKVVLYAPVKLRWRICLGINTTFWGLAPFAMMYTIGNVFYGFEVRPWIRFLANYSYATCLVLYLIGLKANMDEHGITNRWRRYFWTTIQIILLPAFSAIESIGVLRAIFRPSRGFDVVKK